MTTTRDLNRIMRAIRRVLRRREHLHLLKPKWRRLNLTPGAPASTGFCSIAAEALYFLGGGKEAGLTPQRWKDARTGDSHWWIVDAQGRIFDPTADQFEGDDPGYERGRGGGFMTPRGGLPYQPPSDAAAELMEAVAAEFGKHNTGHRLPDLVYHGTHAPEAFTMLGSPGWVTDERAAAEFYAEDRYGETPDASSRVLIYKFKKQPHLLYVAAESSPDMLALADIWEAETGDRLSTEYNDHGSDLIEAFYSGGDRLFSAAVLCRHGYDGWVVPGALEEGGADIMICQPKKFLQYVETILL